MGQWLAGKGAAELQVALKRKAALERRWERSRNRLFLSSSLDQSLDFNGWSFGHEDTVRRWKSP